ncbi:MAG: hypothetical protein JSS30_02195 [Verrucomicrobia bacterium]|nr:hypothetical protein [Verrucomicrobiota bacterium]
MKLLGVAVVLSACAFPLYAEKEFVINLKNPEFSDGVLKTDEGGVITAPCLRIQACHISYSDRPDEQIICASGNLMMEYNDRVFIGECLHYDLLTRTGYLLNARAEVAGWYAGGDRIDLDCDGTFTIYGAYLTLYPGQDNLWQIRANTATITEGEVITARNVQLRVLDRPLFWIPFYKNNLTKFIDPPIRFYYKWDTGLGPRLSMRYRFYATENFSAYARLDCRFTLSKQSNRKFRVGPGGAIEAEYESDDGLAEFQSRNYAAYDKTVPNETGWRRYRFQGIYKIKSADEYSRFHVQWDKLSDDRMVKDFANPDFEVNTQKTTYLELSRYKPSIFTGLTVRPRINSFDTLKQELPYGVIQVRPFEIGRTGVIMENYFTGSFLDYTYVDQLEKQLRDRRSGRLETMNTLYRPFSVAGINFTPRAGVVGIYYSRSPNHHAARQFLYTYGADLNCRFSRQFACVKHTAEPYARFLGYTRPNVHVNRYYVFDIHDGYDKVNQLRFGLRQLFFNRGNSIFLPALTVDLFSYAFWGAKSFDQTIPKAFLDLKVERPSYALRGGMGWNFQENVLDYGNLQLLWTVNASLAFGVEYLHRSKFWWRKADHDNFVLDFARPLDLLLDSPLSDRRNTLLFKAHFRLSPRWNVQAQAHHGWGRSTEPSYTGAKVDFYTMITGSWQMKLSYEYSRNNPFDFSYSFKLIK